MSYNRFLSLKSIYSETFRSLLTKPSALVPMGVFALLEAIALALITLSPRQPFAAVLGPPVQAFFGDQYLHYPFNFLLMPRLMTLARTALAVIAGSVLAGATVLMVSPLGKRPKTPLAAIFAAMSRSGRLLCLFSFLALVFWAINKVLIVSVTGYFASHQSFLFIGSGLWKGPILISLSLSVGIFCQALFLYAVPGIALDNKSLLASVRQSFLLFVSRPVLALALVAMPSLMYVPVVIANYNSPLLIERLFPEAVLVVTAAGIVINAFMVDLVTFSSAAMAYARIRSRQ